MFVVSLPSKLADVRNRKTKANEIDSGVKSDDEQTVPRFGVWVGLGKRDCSTKSCKYVHKYKITCKMLVM